MNDSAEHRARDIALTLISLARHPKLTVGPGRAIEDTKTADREATLALAAAMVYLADTLAGSDTSIKYEEPMRA